MIKASDILRALDRAGFHVAKNVAHPLLGPTAEDQWTIWCNECNRDGGIHHKDCSKSSHAAGYREGVEAERRRIEALIHGAYAGHFGDELAALLVDAKPQPAEPMCIMGRQAAECSMPQCPKHGAGGGR